LNLFTEFQGFYTQKKQVQGMLSRNFWYDKRLFYI